MRSDVLTDVLHKMHPLSGLRCLVVATSADLSMKPKCAQDKSTAVHKHVAHRTCTKRQAERAADPACSHPTAARTHATTGSLSLASSKCLWVFQKTDLLGCRCRRLLGWRAMHARCACCCSCCQPVELG